MWPEGQGLLFRDFRESEPEMFPESGGRDPEIHIERAKLRKTGAHLVKPHLIHDFLQGIRLMSHERDAPFPIIEAG